MVATDLIRAAQFHHATGVWIAALPPLSLYQTGPRCKNDQDIYSHRAISYSSNADIYFTRNSDRRSIQTQEEFRSDCFEKWTLASVSYEDCFLLEWCYRYVCDKRFFSRYFRYTGCLRWYSKTGFSMIFPWVFSMNNLGDALTCQVGWPLVPAFVDYCGISQMPTLWLQFGGKILHPLKRARFLKGKK